MLYTVDDDALFDKKLPEIGYALSASKFSEVAEITIRVDYIDNLVEDVRIKTFGPEHFQKFADCACSVIVGHSIEDLSTIVFDTMAQEFGLTEDKLHYASTLEAAVKGSIENYTSKQIEYDI